ncbi:hypothetical protein [Mammaliicoccus sciuri]|uniref:hypothetical protein n=1 Tax=Mammaliicoccus sciuri TaxID=1296 RepID=UPI001C3D871B|nr:hypothetical protein [Mammaliicoccus sciuri]MBV5103423.1 hypothetical protein [Mammaliicoccus sciuri]
MAYEHERCITHLIEHKLFTEGIDPKEETRAIDELKEVYAKAKAFNEIVGLRNNHYIYSKTNSGTTITLLDAKPFGREVSHLINKNKYMEDE